MAEAKKKNPSAVLFTTPFILSYPKLLKAEPYMENGVAKGDPVFSFEGISPVESLGEWKRENKESGEFEPVNVEKLLVQLAKERFGDDFSVKDAVKLGALSWPFKSGDKHFEQKGEKAKHYQGKKFWRAKALTEINGNPNEPNYYIAEKGGLTRVQRGTTVGDQLIGQKFYPGAICTAEVCAVAGVSGTNKYVTFYLNAIVFEKDGERLGGGSGVERLRGVSGGSSNYDPTQGLDDDGSDGGGDLDDEIPF